MSTRGSRISRVIEYFKSSEIEEARIVWTRVNEIMSERVRLPKLKRAPRRAAFKHKDVVGTVSAQVGPPLARTMPGGE